MLVKKIMLLHFIGALFCLLPTLSYSQIIDNSAPDNDWWTLNECGGTTFRRLATPFTTPAGNDYVVTSIQVKQHANNYVGYFPFIRIETVSGFDPSNTIVTNGTSEIGACTSTGGWITIKFTPGMEPILSPSTNYFLVLTGDASSTLSTGSFRFNNLYTAGTGGLDSRWSFTSSCGAEVWEDATWTDDDLLFKITGYCLANATCDEYIENVQVGSINNASMCTETPTSGYTNFTDLSTDMTVGNSYPMTVACGGYAYSLDECSIWVDWNQDGDFNDANETIAVGNSPGDGHVAGDGVYTATITPPGTAVLGETRMRVRIAWNLTPSSCGAEDWGETEDYTINVVAPSADQTIYTCSDVFYDKGGSGGNYLNGQDYKTTYTSANYSCIRAVISYYDLEPVANTDYLRVYDGTDETGILLKTIVGNSIDGSANTLDDNGTALYGLSGSLTFQFHSDGATNRTGWKIAIDCPDNCYAPVCSDNAVASDYCETSTDICNLNGYCGNTSSSYGADHGTDLDYDEFCGSIENNSWLSFVAENDTAKVEVWTENCTFGVGGGTGGIQIRVFSTDCSDGSFVPKSNCWSPRTEANGVITATGLIPGSEYLIMIDGWGGDACDYSFAASSGVVVANAGDDKTMCEGEVVTLSASGGTNYSWSNGSTTQNINVSPSSTTTYTLSVTGSNPNCPGTDDAVVFVNSATAGFTGLSPSYCADYVGTVLLTGDYTTNLSSYSISPGPGLNDSLFTPSLAGVGSHTITYTYNYSVVTAFFEDFDPAPLPGWSHAALHAITGVSDPSKDSWAYGKPMGGNGDNTASSAYADPKMDHSPNSTNNVYGQGLSSSNGNGLGGYFDYANEYLRSPAMNCSELVNTVLSFWAVANFEDIYDEAYVKISNDGVAWYTLPEPAYPADQQWTQRIYDISAYADGQATVYVRWQSISDINTTNSGWNIDDISVTGVKNGGSCVSTESQSTTISPKPTSTFSISNPLCTTSSTTTSYSGSASGGATYTWNFNGGSASPGTGQGPQSVSWASPGTYNVSLSVSENGCSSTNTSHSVTVPSAVSISSATTPASCGSSNGSATVTPSGGTGAGTYSYNWQGGQTTATISGVTSGAYPVTVTDANGCTKTASINIADAGGPTASISISTNVTCNGAANGSATASATGGTGGYTYSWSAGAGTLATATGLSGTTYTVTVKDGNNCASTASVTITEPAIMIASATKTDVSCYSGSNGTIDLTVTGGNTITGYNWNSGQTIADLSGLSYGTYSVTATDNKGCTASTSVTINQPTELIATVAGTSISCFGVHNGAINLTVAGGTTNYSYSWTGPSGYTSSVEDITGLYPGTYSAQVTDAKSCLDLASYTVTEPSVLDINPTITAAKCYGSTDGGVVLNPTGGSPGNTYSWSSGQTTANLSNVLGENYFISITDANGCTLYEGVTIPEPTILTASTTPQSVSCYGLSDGSIDMTVSGGNTTFSYVWTGPNSYSSTPSNGDISGLIYGTYYATVTDNKGCTTTASATVPQPDDIVITTSSTPSSCGGSVGTATVDNVTGGSGSYTYLWSYSEQTTQSITGLPSGSYTVTVNDGTCQKTKVVNVNDSGGPSASINTSADVSCNGAANGSATVTYSGGTGPFTITWSVPGSTATISGLSGGTYWVTVKDDNNCESPASVVIDEPSTLVATLTPVNPLCNGNNNGNIGVSVTGGTTPYSFTWDDGPTSQNRNGLTSGNYSLTVTDQQSCITTGSASLINPSALNVSIAGTNIKCYGGGNGQALASVNGGTTPYSYFWSPSGGAASYLNNLSAGTYSVLVTDYSGCTNTDTVIITAPPLLTLSSTTSQVSCFGLNDGSINLTVSGGTPGYQYSWTGGMTSEDLNSLPAGAYYVEVEDAEGCLKNTTIAVTQPAKLITSLSKTNLNCFGQTNGAVDVTASGGTSGYNYSWIGPGSYTSTPANGDISSLSGGLYSLTITDARGCSIDTSTTITEPDSIVVNSTSSPSTCGFSSGDASVVVSGGTVSYSYFWNTGGTTSSLTALSAATYSVTVTDGNGCTKKVNVDVGDADGPSISVDSSVNILCNGESSGSIAISVTGGTSPYNILWSTGSNDTILTNLNSGTYSVQVTDDNSCVDSKSIVITEPTPFVTTLEGTNPDCYGDNNGSINLIVSGGKVPYTYDWSNGATTQDISGLPPGPYDVIATDGNGCTSTGSVSITQPSVFSVNIAGTDIVCYGQANGSALANVTGGTSPFGYLWSTNSTNNFLSGLTKGTYTVIVTDNNGCSALDTVYIDEPDVLAMTSTVAQINCYGDGNGSITVVMSGGTTPYTYSWTPNVSTSSMTSNLIPGTYQLVVTDFGSCSTNDSWEITQPTSELSISDSVNNVTCAGNTNGSIYVVTSGGTPNYSYIWSGPGSFSATQEDLTGLSAGNYYLTVTDAKGCNVTLNTAVTEANAMSIVATSTNAACGMADGTATVTITGGASPHTILWSNSGTDATITGLMAGNYNVTVTDNNGCSASGSSTVNSSGSGTITPTITDAKCFGDDDGSISVQITGTVGLYSYWWSTGDSTIGVSTIQSQISNLTAGNYSLTITDGAGCVNILNNLDVDQYSEIVATANVTHISCNGALNGTVNLQVSGGTPFYQFSWSNGGSTQTISGLSGGTYIANILDSKNCYVSVSSTVQEPAALALTFSSTPVTCSGTNNGTVSVVVAGGILPYFYSWSNGSNTPNLSNLAQDIYSVTVSDANSCSTTGLSTVSAPSSMDVTLSKTDISCYGTIPPDGNITANVTGGSTPYSYVWSPYGNTQTISGLSSGVYSVSVTDANNCTISASATIVEPTALAVDTTVNAVTSYGASDGSIVTSTSGGTSPYAYSWNTGSSTSNLTGIATGTYSLTVTDAHGCYVVNNSIFVNQPDFNMSLYNTGIYPVSCYGADNGAIQLHVSGGSTPYSYIWSTSQTSDSIYNLAASTYYLTVYDNNMTPLTDSFLITQPTALVADTLSIEDATCIDGNDGVAIAYISGGVPPYSYTWSTVPEQTGYIAAELISGDYNVTITDTTGCTLILDVPVGAIDEDCLFIPNIFTPNGDGYNDKWYIRHIDLYPEAEVIIFNRWGDLIFESDHGYSEPWDGTYKGKELPISSFVYIVKLNNGSEPLNGVVSIIR